MNLEDWTVPQPLVEEMIRVENDEHLEDHGAHWRDAHVRDGFARSGWVSLAVRWRRGNWRSGAELDSYEVGINGDLVGRIQASDSDNALLALNWAHPLFDSLPRAAPSPLHASSVSAAPDPERNGSQLAIIPLHGQPCPLPAWDSLLLIDDARLENDHGIDAGGRGSVAFAEFRALLSGAFVGVGLTLQDELARCRYVGPVRELHPPTDSEPGTSSPGSWSDGSAAWSLLARAEPPPGERGLLDDVNAWLTNDDRLDTGYMLQQRATIELPADDVPVSTILFVERALGGCRDEAGDVDWERWVQREAEEIADHLSGDAKQVEAGIRTGGGAENESPDADAAGRRDPVEAGLITRRPQALSGAFGDF